MSNVLLQITERVNNMCLTFRVPCCDINVVENPEGAIKNGKSFSQNVLDGTLFIYMQTHTTNVNKT
jgi:hypothetical protein